MPRTTSSSGVRAIDYTGDGIADTSALASTTEIYDDLNTLTFRAITADLTGDGVPDYRSERSFAYDEGNRLVREVEAHGGPAGAFLITSTRAYDALGRQVAIATDVDQGGDAVTDTRTIERFTHDELSRVSTHAIDVDVGADGTVDARTVYSNAYLPQLIVIAGEVDGNGDGTIDSRSRMINSYDTLGRLLSNTSEEDYNGDLVVDYRAAVFQTYDAAGNVATETLVIDQNADGRADFARYTSNTYDATGQLTATEVRTDFNGDGIIDDIFPPPVPGGPVTPAPEQPTEPEKIRVPDDFGLLDRDQDGDGRITIEDFDNNILAPAEFAERDGIIDEYDDPLYANVFLLLNPGDDDHANLLGYIDRLLSQYPDYLDSPNLRDLRELIASNPWQYDEASQQFVYDRKAGLERETENSSGTERVPDYRPLLERDNWDGDGDGDVDLDDILGFPLEQRQSYLDEVRAVVDDPDFANVPDADAQRLAALQADLQTALEPPLDQQLQEWNGAEWVIVQPPPGNGEQDMMQV